LEGRNAEESIDLPAEKPSQKPEARSQKKRRSQKTKARSQKKSQNKDTADPAPFSMRLTLVQELSPGLNVATFPRCFLKGNDLGLAILPLIFLLASGFRLLPSPFLLASGFWLLAFSSGFWLLVSGLSLACFSTSCPLISGSAP
jgi:hypothetical protein